ncbi:nucleotidyl transferase AbiEii/AbiGii toxin family protein [Archangium violaceum]|nr:nucleotidyl transferase AbiEii/AbiGii toxin family protein [Archangium violaceum]
MTVKNLEASVQACLQNHARATKRPFQELLQYYAMERFLYRLSKTPHRARFVLKGALMLHVWDVPLARATKDLDFLGRLDFPSRARLPRSHLSRVARGGGLAGELPRRARLRSRRASRQEHLPAVPRARRLRDDARHLGWVDALLGDANLGTVVGGQRLALGGALRPGHHARVGLARVRERLALPVLDVEQPLLRTRLAEAERAALAVVEDVCRLVDDEVGERIVLGEVVRRDVAGRLLADPDEARGLLAEQLRADAEEVQVCEVPR